MSQPKLDHDVAGTRRALVRFHTKAGEFKHLLTAVMSAEVIGIMTTPDDKAMSTNTQHPAGRDLEAINLPAPTDDFSIPRACTIVLRRKDGGTIGF